MTVISFLFALRPLLSHPRQRTVERRWSVRVGNRIEVNREHRETDIRS